MSDIFVSYASEDRPRVKVLAEALETQGWSVWWDRSIPFGKRFHQVIEEELAAARSVMVIWSASSVGSDWVRAEAGEGMARGILVPVSIDDAPPPLVFRQIQTADLAGWEGDLASPVFRKLMADLQALLGLPPERTVEPLAREPEARMDKGEHVSSGAEVPMPPSVPPTKRSPGRWEEGENAARLEEEGPLERATRVQAKGRWPWIAAGIAATVVLAVFLWRWLAPAAPPTGGLDIFDAEAGQPRAPQGQEAGFPRLLAPEILSFTASPDRVTPGGRTLLSWQTRNAERVELDGHPVEPSGAREVPRLVGSALFVLIATGAEGKEVRREVGVLVESVAGPAPSVEYFVVRPTRIEVGGRANLHWSTENSEIVEIEGLGRFGPKGEITVRPDETTVYRLAARSAAGQTASAQAEIAVERAPESRPRFSGPVELREGLTVDLDSGDVSGPKVSQQADLVLAEASSTRPALLTPVNGAAFLVTRDRSVCPRVRPLPARVPREELGRGGLYLCVRTNEGRLSVCRVERHLPGFGDPKSRSRLPLFCETNELE